MEFICVLPPKKRSSGLSGLSRQDIKRFIFGETNTTNTPNLTGLIVGKRGPFSLVMKSVLLS